MAEEQGPNAQINKLRSPLTDQLKKEDALDTTDFTNNPAAVECLEKELKQGMSHLTKAVGDLLQTPFASNLQFKEAQRAALRRVEKALKDELAEPSKENKARLQKANELLVAACRV